VLKEGKRTRLIMMKQPLNHISFGHRVCLNCWVSCCSTNGAYLGFSSLCNLLSVKSATNRSRSEQASPRPLDRRAREEQRWNAYFPENGQVHGTKETLQTSSRENCKGNEKALQPSAGVGCTGQLTNPSTNTDSNEWIGYLLFLGSLCSCFFSLFCLTTL
jgi:hypothetical protein